MSRVKLEPRAGPCRSQAVATSKISPGASIMTCASVATILLPREKNRRCDFCHILAAKLLRCSGCAEYFYCGAKCQTLQWPVHKRLCKRLSKYGASTAVQALAEHEKLEALLLSHLIARLDVDSQDSEELLQSMLSLLPGPVEPPLLPIIYASARFAAPEVQNIYARFGNNNFALHSHLTTFGHGVFPEASRYFNHSCLPNAAAKYRLVQGQRPMMEVVALREIEEGEEVCLPYVDPALLQTKKQIFQLTYGFECLCDSCRFFAQAGKVPEPPSLMEERNALSKRLQQFYQTTQLLWTSNVPPDLLAAFHESFITHLSETFRDASHDGQYSIATSSGNTLLALYSLVYPLNYPQIGMHLLELAKTSWNSIIMEDLDAQVEKQRVDECRAYLDKAREISSIFGAEGDEDGPLVEITTLQNLTSA
ncbi:hypothetical protein HMN09_00963700 [Mycena chlorophos]|uniref:SET domain-containing protein n=1 Tax=Mycena chlorophos TaxID=658473 RepID=A0A8H6SHR5_MYCCL|nr:hypothetical protein HMN09_00963700 [Mycena chlorophos]